MQTENSNARVDSRSNVFLMASLMGNSMSCPVRIRNLSVNGALLEGGSLPAPGATSDLRRGSLRARGEIAWRRDRFCGIRFASAIDVAEWIRRAGTEAQQSVDAEIARARGHPDIQARSRPKTGECVDVSAVSSELLEICERIAALPDMSTELAVEVMKIELAARSLQSVLDNRS